MEGSILLAVDGSKQSDLAAYYAAELGELAGASVVILHVVDKNSAADGRANARRIVREAGRILDKRGVTHEPKIREGEPWREIMEESKSKSVAHVVMGCRGLSGVARILLGSTAENVVRYAKKPVTVVR